MTTELSSNLHLSDGDFSRIAKLLSDDCGIVLDPSKKVLVHGRLEGELSRLRQPNYSSYLEYISSPQGADDKREMVSLLTTNLTYFFRERHHFDLLRDDILPGLSEKAKSGQRVRIWSAGCSEGMEAYTIAMTVLSGSPDMASRDFRILATDIDPRVLRIGQRGVYPENSLSRVPENFQEKYFSRSTDGYSIEVDDQLKSLVHFRRFNLKHQAPPGQRFDVIFCRNVIIYLDDETREIIWQTFAQCLPEGGLLCIGHSERISNTGLQYFEQVGLTAFRRNGRGC